MTDVKLVPTDLPLGTVFPEAPYNVHMARALEAARGGAAIADGELRELEAARQALWAEIVAFKARGMDDYARFACAQHGFAVDSGGRLAFDWKATDFRRVGYGSEYYTCDRAEKTLVPTTIDHRRPRVFVFATGRAFAEKNARLGRISPEDAVDQARAVMSAQVYLVGSRIVPGWAEGEAQVAAVAYDMVTSEEETPALRYQAILDPAFVHPVSIRAAERIFAPLIGELECYPTGRIVRREGRIIGKPRSGDEVIANLSNLVLVGASVGCIVSLQVARWLDVLLQDLGFDDAVRDEAARSFLVVNLGPTSTLAAGPRTNLVSVVNSVDEFVFAGNDLAPTLARVQVSGRRLVPADPAADPASASSFTLVLDVAGSTLDDAGGLAFDPLRTHFGHSLKHYANGLANLGFGSVVGRALASCGAQRVGALIAAAEAAGELRPRIADRRP